MSKKPSAPQGQTPAAPPQASAPKAQLPQLGCSSRPEGQTPAAPPQASAPKAQPPGANAPASGGPPPQLPQTPPATPTREARNAPPALPSSAPKAQLPQLGCSSRPEGPLPHASRATPTPRAPQAHEAPAPAARTIGFDPAVWGGPPLRNPAGQEFADVWEEWVDTPDAEDYRRSRAQLQTDPARQRMRLNALKHGLCAKSVIVPGESAEAYDEMRADLLDQFRPDTPQEEMMVDQLAQAYWMLLRARRKEAELQAHQAEMPVWEWSDDYFRSVERFNRYRSSIERAYYRALTALQKFQKEWRKANPVGGHDNDRIKVLHIVYRTSDPESSYVMRIVSSSAKHGISYTEKIPLSEYRGGIYLRDDIPDEQLDEAA